MAVLPRLLRPGDGDQGAVLVNAIAFGGLWIVIGLLLWAAGSRAEERV